MLLVAHTLSHDCDIKFTCSSRMILCLVTIKVEFDFMELVGYMEEANDLSMVGYKNQEAWKP